MGMSIEEIIEIEHKYLDDNESTFEMESLFDSFISVMEKYQKIEEIVNTWRHDITAGDYHCMAEVAEVVEDGNVD